MTSDFHLRDVDAGAATALAASDLRLGLVDTEDREAFGVWLQTGTRGFHGSPLDESDLAASLDGLAYRRTTGVWDDAGDPVAPVGTVSSWPAPLTVPGGSTVEAWAISAVTVASTHRRRGIARGMLEAELRTASALGVPLAMLTVSESTIYGRFGFAPAAMAADLRIDTRRANWAGRMPAGRLQFVSREEARALLPVLSERSRMASAGEIAVWDLRWDQFVGIVPGEGGAEGAKKLRAVRYDDEAGTPQGLVLYRVSSGDRFEDHSLEVEHLIAATEDAYAALWRMVLEVDLVTEVRASLRSVDEPLRWQVSDYRAVRVTTEDHLWLRILDVPATLSARRYLGAGRIGLEVSDPYGFADGRFLVTVADGEAAVERQDGPLPAGVPALALSVNELSALYLGGVAATTLVAAGRVTELAPDAAVGFDSLFRSPKAPWLSVWF